MPDGDTLTHAAMRRNRLPDTHGRELSIGIGIVTYNRPAALVRSIQHVIQHTKRPFQLVVADDGSTDETSAAVAPFRGQLSYLKCQNRGVNFNKNRLLYYFARIRLCDVIIILEDDAFPNADGWEEKWIAGVQKWGHINNAGQWFASHFTAGAGSLEAPYLCPDVSAQCVGYSRETIEFVGFIDPAFENYGGAHAEHTYRMTRAGYGGDFIREEGVGKPSFYLIEGDIAVYHEKTGYPVGDTEGLKKYYELRDGPLYRHAWRTDAEQAELWAELATIHSGPHEPVTPTTSKGGASLDAIGIKNGTDKNSTPAHHDYLTFYEQVFESIRHDTFTFLEIGVYRGSSLHTWGEYFQNATVVGADIDPAANVPISLPNVHIRLGDASRLEFLDELVAEFGRPRVIVDDGSHFWHHQIETFRYLWPRLKPGGIYIMEDLHTSFPLYEKVAAYRGLSQISTYDYLLKFNRWVVGNRAMDTEIPDDGFIGSYWPTIRSIHWYRGTCIIYKQENASVRPPLKTG